MKKYTKINFLTWFLISLLSGTGCDIDKNVPENQIASEAELLLSRTWKYDSVVINGLALTLMNRYFEPPAGNEFLEVAADITRRYVHYKTDRSYQLRWKETDNIYWYEPPNWQPSYGYYLYVDSTQTLIHSPLQTYQHTYDVLELSATRFIRVSDRIMELNTAENLWQPGDTVRFYEYFSPLEN